MYYVISKQEIWDIRRALDTGEGLDEAKQICEDVLIGTPIIPPIRVDTVEDDNEIEEFLQAEGC